MNAKAADGRRPSAPSRRCFVFAMFLVLTLPALAILGATRSEAAESRPMQIRIDAPTVAGNRFRFAVHVIAPGTPVLLVPGGEPRSATLEVNAEIRQTSIGATRIGVQPVGTSVIALGLSGVTARDTIVVHVDRGDGTLLAVRDLALLTTATRSSLLSGMYFAFLLCIAVFVGAQWFKKHEWTTVWFVLWVLGSLLLKATIDGFLGSTRVAGSIATASIVVTACGMTGFVVAYLRLPREAPRLMWWVLGVGLVSSGMPPVAAHLLGAEVARLALLAPLAGMLPLLCAAVIRRRRGFLPAGVLILGLAAQYATFVLEFMAAQSITIIPLLNGNWLFGSTAFDLALFGFAAATRQRYILVTELRHSKYDANHDPLTGLLNRRGLDAWMRDARSVSTVFFIDLDGFKAVNDRGGHAAGDEALRSVSNIIRAALRECDAVARVGGDEFVVVLAGEPKEATIRRIREQIGTEVGALEPLGSLDPTRIGASIGIGILGDNQCSLEGALQAADADAYRIKNASARPAPRPT